MASTGTSAILLCLGILLIPGLIEGNLGQTVRNEVLPVHGVADFQDNIADSSARKQASYDDKQFKQEKKPSVNMKILVDFQEEITKGVTNTTLLGMIEEVREDLRSRGFFVQTEIIHDFETFSAEIEDDPSVCESLTVVLSAVSCRVTRQLYLLLTDYCPGTVTLAIHDRTCTRPSHHHGIGFPVQNTVKDVIPMIIDLRHDFLLKWDHINLIHDESIGDDMVHKYVDGLTTSEVHNSRVPEVVVYSVNTHGYGVPVRAQHGNCTIQHGTTSAIITYTSDHLVEHLLEDDTMKYFIVIASSSTIANMVEQAHNKSLMIAPRKWLLIFTDTERSMSYWNNLSPLLALTETAVVRRKLSEYRERRCSSLMSEGCQFTLAMKTLVTSMSKVFTNLTGDDMMILTSNRKLARNKLLHEMTLDLSNAQNYLCGSCDKFVLQVYERTGKKEDPKPWLMRKQKPPSVFLDRQDFDVSITHSGDWTPTRGYVGRNFLFPAQVTAFGNKTIRVAVFQQLPRIRLQIDAKDRDNCTAIGATPEIIKLLAERLTFQIKWVCIEGSFGRKNPRTGAWDGIMKLLIDKKADMAANPFWKLPSWRKEVAWSRAFSEESAVMMVEKSTEDQYWLWMLPFTWDVWYCLILSIIVIPPFIWYVNGRCKYYDYNNIRRDKGLFSLQNCYYYSYAAFVGQGGDYLPPCLTTRIIVAFWWLFVIVVATMYSGNLVACLTFPKIFQPIQNVQDLLNAWFMDWATQSDGPLQEVTQFDWKGLKEGKSIDVLELQPIHRLSDKMKFYDLNERRGYIFDEVGHDSLAWIGLDEEVKHSVSVDYLTNGICRLHRAKDDVYRAPVYFPFRKDYPPEQIKAMNEQLDEIGSAGFIVHWMRYYEQLGNDCLQPFLVYAGDVRKVELLHMYGSYVILAIGMAVSFVLLVLELGFWKWIRPCLPDSWKASKSSAMDYYNKIFTGYGYSNMKTMSPERKKVKNKVTIALPPTSLNPGSVGLSSSLNGRGLQSEMDSPSPLGDMVSTSSHTLLFHPSKKAYNRSHFNYYNYSSKSNFRTNFKPKFALH